MDKNEAKDEAIGFIAVWMFRTIVMLITLTVAGWLYTHAAPADSNLIGLVLWMLLVGDLAERAFGWRSRE